MEDFLSLEELMVKAIIAFRRCFKWSAEIRSVFFQQGTGDYDVGWSDAVFEVESVVTSGGGCLKAYVTVYASILRDSVVTMC